MAAAVFRGGFVLSEKVLRTVVARYQTLAPSLGPLQVGLGLVETLALFEFSFLFASALILVVKLRAHD